MTQGSRVSSVAARIGSEEFFEPLTFIEPESGCPPCTRILSIPGKNEPSDAVIIVPRANVAVFFFRQSRKKSLTLPESYFQSQHSTGPEPRWSLINQVAHELIPPRSGEQSNFRIVQHFARKRMPVPRRDIRKIRDNKIENSRNTLQQSAS